MRSTPFSLLVTMSVLALSACSDDSAGGRSDAGEDTGGIRDISGHDVTPTPTSMGVDAGVDADEPDLPPLVERVESVTYLREFDECDRPNCQVELLFSLTGEMMLRVQMGNITDSYPLAGEELRELRELAGDDLFVARVRNGFSCPPPEPDANFLVRLRTIHRMPDGSLDTELIDVTGCYYGDGAPRADGLIDYAELMYLRYFGQL